MGLSANQYQEALLSLLPQGAAWPKNDNDSQLNQLLLAIADELARLDARADALIEEADPRTTTNCLVAWERVAGLPDPCAGQLPTIQQRRQALVAKLTGTGGQSKAYLIQLALQLGYSITITEFEPWRVDQPVDQPIYGEQWVYAFQVNAPAVTITEWRVSSPVNEPLRAWGNKLLECVITRYKPAHTQALFAYG